MAKLKGTKRLEKVVNKFTKKNFGVTAKMGAEFLAYCDSQVINFTLAMNEDDVNYYLNDVKERYPYIQANIFLWCLLHEVGHCKTDYLWSAEENAYFMKQKEDMTSVEDDKVRNAWYHALPDEYIATKWAGEYMTNHPKKIAKFWSKMQAELLKFYVKNGLLAENEG